MRNIFAILLFSLVCFGAVGERKVWQNGYTFLNFLMDHQIPLRLYYNLPAQDKELTAEINAGIGYQVLKDSSGNLLQALIPIDEEVQIHIYQEHFQYKLTLIPIHFFSKKQTLAIKIKNSPHQDIFESSKDLGLANEFLNTYKKSINFKREVISGDRLVILYTRKYRFGEFFGTPSIQATMIETNKKANYLFAYNDGRFYDLEGKEIAGFLLQMPLATTHITSKFSKARRHPVLQSIIRPHFGIDFRAKVGTPVYAAGNGKIISAGWKGGYGKAIEIAHEGGLRTLYAHLSKIDPKIRSGMYVKQGRLIGRSGNTGLSSGPHLHFGLYKNSRPVDPLGSVKTTKSKLTGKQKQHFMQVAQNLKENIEMSLKDLESVEFSSQTQGEITQSATLEKK